MLADKVNTVSALYKFYQDNTRAGSGCPRGSERDSFRYNLFVTFKGATLSEEHWQGQHEKYKLKFPGDKYSKWASLRKSVQLLLDAWAALNKEEKEDLSASVHSANGSSFNVPNFGALQEKENVTPNILGKRSRGRPPKSDYTPKRKSTLPKLDSDGEEIKEPKKSKESLSSADEDDYSMLSDWSKRPINIFPPLPFVYDPAAHADLQNKVGEKLKTMQSFKDNLSKNSEPLSQNREQLRTEGERTERLAEAVLEVAAEQRAARMDEAKKIVAEHHAKTSKAPKVPKEPKAKPTKTPSLFSGPSPVDINVLRRIAAKGADKEKLKEKRNISVHSNISDKENIAELQRRVFDLGSTSIGLQGNVDRLQDASKKQGEEIWCLQKFVDEIEQGFLFQLTYSKRLDAVEEIFWKRLSGHYSGVRDPGHPLGGKQNYQVPVDGEYRALAQPGSAKRLAQDRAKCAKDISDFLKRLNGPAPKKD